MKLNLLPLNKFLAIFNKDQVFTDTFIVRYDSLQLLNAQVSRLSGGLSLASAGPLLYDPKNFTLLSLFDLC